MLDQAQVYQLFGEIDRLPGIEREWQAVLQGRKPFDFRVWRWVNLIRWAERFDVSFAA